MQGFDWKLGNDFFFFNFSSSFSCGKLLAQGNTPCATGMITARAQLVICEFFFSFFINKKWLLCWVVIVELGIGECINRSSGLMIQIPEWLIFRLDSLPRFSILALRSCSCEYWQSVFFFLSEKRFHTTFLFSLVFPHAYYVFIIKIQINVSPYVTISMWIRTKISMTKHWQKFGGNITFVFKVIDV